MAVPASGNSLSMLGIFSEKNENDYTAANIDGENSISLRGLSSNSHGDTASGGNINLNADSAGNAPNQTAPYAMSEFYTYDHDATSITDIPTTNYAQNNGTNYAAFCRDSHTSGIVMNLQALLEVRMRRADPYVYLEVRERNAGNDYAAWYNTSNNATTLSTSYVTLARWNLTGITAIKIDWTGPTGSGFGSCYLAGETNGPNATYNAQDNTWRTISNNQSIAFAFTASASAECFASNMRTCSTVITGYARKSGYNDTSMGSYLITSRATATSNNCF